VRVLALLDRLDARGLPVWLDGGWGVDALLERQTRTHDDLDLLVRLEDLDRIEAVLRELGYVFTGEARPGVVEYLVDAEGHQVDVHPVVLSHELGGIYTMENGDEWIYPPGAFTGNGRILDREVRCLTPDVVLVSHTTGYALDQAHERDAIALSERFGIPLPEYETASDA
jgi:lincosamide nucleotidyltransferase A/C/D/E